MTSHRILIVEDEIFVALDLERILATAGYSVAAIAADREEAMAAATAAKVAFVDVNLRDGPSGPAIVRDLSGKHGVKVFYVTANPSQIAPSDGALGYIRKPFRPAAILSAAAYAMAPGMPLADNDDIVLFPEVMSVES
jgi:CheY-like chemotaxis protein